MKPIPPRWADKFLEWYCRTDLLEEIQGDAYELYDRTAKGNERLADLMFVWNVFRFFRLKNVSGKRINPPAMMFKSYLVVGFRSALRNGATSFINIAGLTLGVAAAITMFIFADQFFHTDNGQKKIDRIYQVTNLLDRDGKPYTLSDTPILLGPVMTADNPAIESSTRIESGGGYVRYQENVFSEKIWYVDPSFFQVFTFDFQTGDDRALFARNNVVITKPIAEKYFGTGEAFGKTFSIKFNADHTEEFTVAGVIDLPAANTLHFNILMNIDVFFDLKQKDQYNWDYFTDATFILLKEAHGIEEVQPSMDSYKKLQNESSPDWKITEFKFYPFSSLATEGYKIESYMAGPGPPQGVIALFTISVFLLLLACFNYMNISIATISMRLKEIGIRKVIGSTKSEIIQQFVTENVLMCTISIALGLLLSYLFFMPGLITLIGYEVPFAFSSGQSMIFFFSALLVLVVIASGVYPAVYVSRFQPVTILKRSEKFNQRSLFSRALLTLQFALAFTTIVGCFVFIDNAFYLKNKDWGYDHDQNLVLRFNTKEQFLKLRDAVAGKENVVSFAGTSNHIGYWNTHTSVNKAEEKFEAVRFNTGFDYLQTMNLRLREGRFFDSHIQSDKLESVVVNEKFVLAMGWENAIGQTFEYDSVKRNVIGVVHDFHYRDYYEAIYPVMITIVPEEDFRYFVLKAARGHVNETESWLKETWKNISRDDPYEGSLQDDVFAHFNKQNQTDIKILIYITALALILACLGLFGLVSYNITRRLKEFSLRKIFGAHPFQLFNIMQRDYVWILGIAFLLGAPAGFFLMDTLVHFIYIEPQTAGVAPFITAMVLMFITILMTVGTQLGRVLREDPAQTLRSE